MDDSPGRATGTENDDAAAADVESGVGLEAGEESDAVGVLGADPTVVDTHKTVGRPERLDRIGALVGCRGDTILVRHRDRHATEAQGAHRVDGGGGIAGADRERHIDPVESDRCERGVVDRRRQRMPDRIADDGRNSGMPVDHPQPRSFSTQTATFALCSSMVTANEWVPSSSVST